jgi:hypothetical protein
MSVYDRTSYKIGTVECVYLDAPSTEASRRGGGPATAPGSRESSLIEDFAKAIAPQDQLPEPLRKRLLRQGFPRIDSTGLFAADRLVMPEQIESVSGDGALLRATNCSKAEGRCSATCSLAARNTSLGGHRHHGSRPPRRPCAAGR